MKQTEAFQVDKRNFGNMDDWLPVGSIKDVKLQDSVMPIYRNRTIKNQKK